LLIPLITLVPDPIKHIVKDTFTVTITIVQGLFKRIYLTIRLNLVLSLFLGIYKNIERKLIRPSFIDDPDRDKKVRISKANR